MTAIAKPDNAHTVLASERLVPDHDSYQRVWHLSRYALAARWAVDRDVLDAGFGEGYGAFFLAQIARSVTAVDYAAVAVEHAQAEYTRPNLTFAETDLNALCSHDGPFDLVTCFEVIEHVEDHDQLLRQFRRRLRRGGTLLMSTPNLLYHGASTNNPYHVSEVGPRKLRREVRRHFSHVTLFGEIDHAQRQRALAKLVVDPLYLRRRLCRDRASVPAAHGGESQGVAAPSQIDFSRLLMRVSPVTMVLALA